MVDFPTRDLYHGVTRDRLDKEGINELERLTEGIFKSDHSKLV